MDDAWPHYAPVESELTKLCNCTPAVPTYPNKFLAFEMIEEPKTALSPRSVPHDQVTAGQSSDSITCSPAPACSLEMHLCYAAAFK